MNSKGYPSRFSPLMATEEYILERYGELYEIAVDCIGEQRTAIDGGFAEDWDKTRKTWDPTEELTIGQEMVLERNQFPQRLLKKMTKLQASYVIDWIFLDDRVTKEHTRRLAMAKQEEIWAKKRAEKEAARAEKEAIKAEKTRLRDMERVATTSREKLIKWRLAFADLWNEVMADDVITLEEVFKIKKWLKSHLVRHDDYADFLACIDRVVVDGQVSQEEMVELYDHAINLIDTIVPDGD